MRGFWAVLRKEAIQMRRDTGTLRFALGIPVFQLVLFGLIDTNVQHVPTAVFDQSQTADSRALVRDFVNTSYFDVLEFVPSRAALRERIVAGRVSVGIEIPPDYARKRLDNQPADFMVLIDGSDSTVSSATLAATNGLSLQKSLEDIAQRTGIRELPVQPFPLLLFNPDSRSANLLIPGLVAILLTFSGTVLAAFSIVRERERGTLEQLMVTPASPVAVVLGKLLPYLVLGFVQLLLVLVLMVFVFRVPIHGNVFLLLVLSVIYLFSLLALGLLVSSRANTQMEAIQGAQGFLLPSIMLSGYIFPLSSLPGPLRVISKVLPATHFISISRGIIIRGAGFMDLWPDVVALLILAAILVGGSTRAFRKTIS
ncbi:MAG: ABC transporter permease [Acidobacteria bacterium]|nr:MAG: ABC transporter permease [Acidobacteriota bacterium]